MLLRSKIRLQATGIRTAIPACSMAPRSRSWKDEESGVSGRRIPLPIMPISCSTHFTGIGLASTNRCAMQPEQLVVDAQRALTRSPRKGSSAHFVHQARRDIGGHRDAAVAAEQHQCERVASSPL